MWFPIAFCKRLPEASGLEKLCQLFLHFSVLIFWVDWDGFLIGTRVGLHWHFDAFCVALMALHPPSNDRNTHKALRNEEPILGRWICFRMCSSKNWVLKIVKLRTWFSDTTFTKRTWPEFPGNSVGGFWAGRTFFITLHSPDLAG